jgi:TPR repeat protein
LTLDDGIEVDADTINRVKKNDGKTLFDIGWKYQQTGKDYTKAMGWYRLAANQNYSSAYNNIGNLYYSGLGVSQDGDISLEYYLKAAGNNSVVPMGNIGSQFLNGQGVPVNKYKALEWLIKCGNKPEKVKALNDQGVHLKEEDTSKLHYY